MTPFTAFSSEKKVDCKVHGIYCSIDKLNPQLDKKYKMEMSNLIYKYSKKYDLPPRLSVAIFMQESTLGVYKHKKEKVLLKMKDCITEPPQFDDSCSERYKIVEGITDVGIWMFSIPTITQYKIDIGRVSSDKDYATEWHFKILKRKISNCKKKYGTTAWACYNSATSFHHKRYVKLVTKWLNKIKDI